MQEVLGNSLGNINHDKSLYIIKKITYNYLNSKLIER